MFGDSVDDETALETKEEERGRCNRHQTILVLLTVSRTLLPSDCKVTKGEQTIKRDDSRHKQTRTATASGSRTLWPRERKNKSVAIYSSYKGILALVSDR